MALPLTAPRRTEDRARRWAGRTHRDGLQSSPLSEDAARGRFGRAGRGAGGAGGGRMNAGGWPARPARQTGGAKIDWHIP